MTKLEEKIVRLESELQKTQHKVDLLEKDIDKLQSLYDSNSSKRNFGEEVLHRYDFSMKAYAIVTLIGSIIFIAYVYYLLG